VAAVPVEEMNTGPEALISIDLLFERFVSSTANAPVMIVAPPLKVMAFSMLVTALMVTSKLGQNRPVAEVNAKGVMVGGLAEATGAVIRARASPSTWANRAFRTIGHPSSPKPVSDVAMNSGRNAGWRERPVPEHGIKMR
jgi:hypothetical protein